jgi:two-component system NtrC family sensor kinase
MPRHLFKFVNNLQLRWKLLVVVLPLVLIPIIVVGNVVGYISTRQANLGLTQTSKDDLDHMATFTIDLLDSHHRQFQVYTEDKKETIRQELSALTNLAYSLVQAQHNQYLNGKIDMEAARREAKKALKKVNVGETGYIYAMTTKGDLEVHIAREGENVYDEKDEEGRHFIRAMCKAAVRSTPEQVLFIVYPWRNEVLGDRGPREKVVAYRYFPEWDWIIATGGYLDETYEAAEFEKLSFEELKAKIKNKKVGRTGYIYCMTSEGKLVVHPDAEGAGIFDAVDSNGFHFIREMCAKKEGWIRYPWQNIGDSEARMKIVRYSYFKPWDWIVAVGSYEDEFYREANLIKGRILHSLVVISLVVGLISIAMVFFAAKVLTDPIHHMISVIRKVKQGRLDQQMKVESTDELGELAVNFNRMTRIIQRNREMESALAQQGKMASLGILSSGVAHEINNPLGVILGYASYMEGKIAPEDPHYKFIHEIKRESKRCKKIVQDLLSYARTPKPTLEKTDVNELLGQIVDFAANHTDMHHVTIASKFSRELPTIMADGDQLRQVAINLILNAGAAMEKGGTLVVGTEVDEDGAIRITFNDNGAGIAEEDLDRIFEPFFTTKARGTGLGLAITRQIVEQHQGRISMESTLGKGTKVTITLPPGREDYR